MARILAVEQNKKDLEHLAATLSHVHPDSEVLVYVDPLLAVQYAFNHPVDAVYAAVSMKRLDGFMLARILRKASRGISVYLIGEDETHRQDASRLALDGYLVRPVTPEAIQIEETAEEW